MSGVTSRADELRVSGDARVGVCKLRFPHPDRDRTSEDARSGRTSADHGDDAFRLLFERSDNAILVLDTDRVVLDMNGPAETLIGRTKQQLTGTSILDVLSSSSREISGREWPRFLREGQYTGQRRLLRGDGSETPVEFAAVLSTVGGRSVAVYVMATVATGWRHRGAAGPGSGRLSKREREVVTLIAMGLDTPRIAAELHVAPATVRAHVRNAMGKLGARTRAQLVALALCVDGAIDMPTIPSQRTDGGAADDPGAAQ